MFERWSSLAAPTECVSVPVARSVRPHGSLRDELQAFQRRRTRRYMLICGVSRPAAGKLAMPDSLVPLVSSLVGLLVLAFYGVVFYVVYLFYKQLRGIRQALDRIADKDTL